MPRKTDSNNPGDWLTIAESELEALQVLAEREISYDMCRGKLAEILEKVLKAELIRCGWFLERTHDLQRLRKELRVRDAELAGGIQPLCTSLARIIHSWIEQRSGEGVRRLDNIEPNENTTRRFFYNRL